MSEQCEWTYSVLKESFTKVSAKRAAGGIDNRTVREYAAHSERNITLLLGKLVDGTYTPDPYKSVAIKKDDGSPRSLSLATVEDKIVQGVVQEYLEKITRRMFLDCSYAYRKGKGHRKAIGRVSHTLRKYGTVIVCDIENFFDTIDHAILSRQLDSIVKDQYARRLITLWVTTGSMKHGRYYERSRGIAQGNLISPVLSNIYLSPFDEFMTGLGYPYIRYSDNWIVFAKEGEHLTDVFNRAGDFLFRQLGLKLHDKSPDILNHQNGFDFLGIHFKNDKRTIAPQKHSKAIKEITSIFRQHKNDSLHNLRDRWNYKANGWMYYYGPYDVAEQFAEMQKHFNKHLESDITRRLKEKKLPEKKIVRDILSSMLLLNKDDGLIRDEMLKKIYSVQDVNEPGVNRSRQGKVRKYVRFYASDRDLVISTPGSFVGKTAGKIQIKKGGTVILEYPAATIRGLLLSQRGISVSTDVIAMCVQRGIDISVLDGIGRHIASITGSAWPQFTVSASQVDASNTSTGSFLARSFARAKVRNQLSLLKYYSKYHGVLKEEFKKTLETESDQFHNVLDKLGKNSVAVKNPIEYRSFLFGLEGQAGAAYWRCIRSLIGPEWNFERREHQNAKNTVNKLLNYGYGILSIRVFDIIVRNGLNPMISFLHTAQANVPTLVFDVMEQFRPTFVDRAIVTMLLRNEKISLDGDFLSRSLRDTIAHRILTKLRSEFYFRGKRQTAEEILDRQMYQLKMFIQGKTTKFNPYYAKW